MKQQFDPRCSVLTKTLSMTVESLSHFEELFLLQGYLNDFNMLLANLPYI